MMRVRPCSLLTGLLAVAGIGWLAAGSAHGTVAVSANDFLDSIGVCVHVQHRQPAENLVPGLKYLGVRAVRDGADGNFDMRGLILLHERAGVLVVFGPGSGAGNNGVIQTVAACRELASAGALLAVEGPNEPNNFGGVTYQGQNSGRLKSWVPVANFQRDLYRAVKSDPVLRGHPVYGPSECGAETDNVGLQFLIIPRHAHTRMPSGTRFADFVNCHNYVSGQITGLIDNQATLAASTKPNVAIDHLFGNHGVTWGGRFHGYTESELDDIPKVTTETGWKTDKSPAGDDRQGKVLLNVFLAQYKAGWEHTFVYEFADDGDGALGFYHRNLATRRKAAVYLHNFTTILADTGTATGRRKVWYYIRNRTPTVHSLLMKKSDGTFALAVWDEQVKGSSNISVDLGFHRATIEVYDPTLGVAPVATFSDARTVPLTMSDHVVVLEFK